MQILVLEMQNVLFKMKELRVNVHQVYWVILSPIALKTKHHQPSVEMMKNVP